MTSKKPRLAYIDLMKGLCIMLIVMHHTDASFFDAVMPGLDNALQSFRVPMYYFLSGLFFKTYSGFGQFLRRKVNNLLIPFVFFHLLGYAVAFALYPLLHPGASFNWHGLIDPLSQRSWSYTVALWFLISLFEVNIIYYGLSCWLARWRWRVPVLIVISVVPLWLASRHIALPLMLDTAFVGLPFFALGNAVNRTGALQPDVRDKWGFVVAPLVAVAVFLLAGHIDILPQDLPTWPQLYLVPMTAILALLWLCKNIPGRVPVIGYWGRYSLIVLGTHDMLLTPLDHLFDGLPWAATSLALLKWGVTMAAMLVVIRLMVRFFPRFTAQQPLLKIS